MIAMTTLTFFVKTILTKKLWFVRPEISLSVRKLRDEQIKHDQTRLHYNEFLKSLVYKYVESTIK